MKGIEISTLAPGARMQDVAGKKSGSALFRPERIRPELGASSVRREKG